MSPIIIDKKTVAVGVEESSSRLVVLAPVEEGATYPQTPTLALTPLSISY